MNTNPLEIDWNQEILTLLFLLFSIKEVWILTQARWLFGTQVYHLLSQPAFWIIAIPCPNNSCLDLLACLATSNTSVNSVAPGGSESLMNQVFIFVLFFLIPLESFLNEEISYFSPSISQHSDWLAMMDLSKYISASLVAQMVKNPPAMQETWVRYLGWEDPLENEMATHSGILAWETPPPQRSLIGYSPWGHKELDMTEWLTYTHIIFSVGWNVFTRQSEWRFG